MTKKEFLRQYLDLSREIDAKLEEVSRYRALATKVTQTLAPDKVQCTQGNKMESIVISSYNGKDRTGKLNCFPLNFHVIASGNYLINVISCFLTEGTVLFRRTILLECTLIEKNRKI